ncbi:hypothetical protein B0H17DRAFT_1219702 [Mycena rosella]|uniref:RING-type domain-containing protein n=1 Tax=Mycena rosella TaxID=1033263 RepID=A0AAD7BGI6_MYCRO|nr:hypothetical protein B0H17DRAFT_1219702 [Mycena rosella]
MSARNRCLESQGFRAYTSEVKARNDYLQCYPLKVKEYLDTAPVVRPAHDSTVQLFKQVYHIFKENTNWQEENRCPICMDARGTSIVLTCTCRYVTLHLKCLLDLRMRNSQDRLVQCPTCKKAAKPVHLDWLVMPKEEKEQRKKNKHTRVHEKRKATVEGRKKERVRLQGRAERRNRERETAETPRLNASTSGAAVDPV